MSKISCEVIRDLLPSCADGIASDETLKEVEEHISECAECRAAYEAMKEDSLPGVEDRQEIDYLKKNRRRNRRIVIFSVLAVCLALAAFAFLKLFVIGEYSNGENVALNVDIDGRRVTVVGAVTDSARVIKRFEFDEKDGVVTVRACTVLAGFYKGDPSSAGYEASSDVQKVVFGNIAYWNRMKEDMYSVALKDDIIADWQRWNGLSDMERLLSSKMPGHLIKMFRTWQEAVDYLGLTPFNPFEDCDWLEKKNYTGTDIESEPGVLNHAYMYYAGDESGRVQYVSLEAGYLLKIGKDVTAGMTTVSKQEDGSLVFVLLNGKDPGSGISIDNGTVTYTENGLTIELVPAPEAQPSEESEVRVVFTVEPAVSARTESEGGERVVTVDGRALFITRESTEKWSSVEISFDLEDVHYNVRLIGDDRDALETAARLIIARLQESFGKY